MTAQKNYSGSCLCGSVEYKITSKTTPGKMFFCHCSHCRKGTGTIHAANIFFDDAQLIWNKGQNNTVHYQLPNTRHSRVFCKTCASPLPNEISKTMIMLPAGSLDSADELKPTAHIQCNSRAQWEDDMQGIPRFEEYP